MNDNDNEISLDPTSSQRIESRIQHRINAGYTAPCGWLFRGLTLFFPQKPGQKGLHLVQNTARFGSAEIVTSLQNSVTHVVVDSEADSADISSLRKSLADRSGKIPHLVGVDWVEECWKNGTLLDEERFQVRR